MGSILQVIGKLLGIADGATTVNKIVGVFDYAALIGAATYLFVHRDETIHFETSLGFLALVVAMAFLLLEVARRSNPKGNG